MHTIDDLRAHLFGTLAALRDKDSPMDIDRARAVSQVAQTVIDTAKVEVEHIRAIGGGVESPFFGGEGQAKRLEHKAGDAPGITGRTLHRLR